MTDHVIKLAEEEQMKLKNYKNAILAHLTSYEWTRNSIKKVVLPETRVVLLQRAGNYKRFPASIESFVQETKRLGLYERCIILEDASGRAYLESVTRPGRFTPIMYKKDSYKWDQVAKYKKVDKALLQQTLKHYLKQGIMFRPSLDDIFGPVKQPIVYSPRLLFGLYPYFKEVWLKVPKDPAEKQEALEYAYAAVRIYQEKYYKVNGVMPDFATFDDSEDIKLSTLHIEDYKTQKSLAEYESAFEQGLEGESVTFSEYAAILAETDEEFNGSINKAIEYVKQTYYSDPVVRAELKQLYVKATSTRVVGVMNIDGLISSVWEQDYPLTKTSIEEVLEQ